MSMQVNIIGLTTPPPPQALKNTATI